MKEAQSLAFLDKSASYRDRIVADLRVYGYNDLEGYMPDVIVLDSPEQHRGDIIQAIRDKFGWNPQILEYKGSAA